MAIETADIDRSEVAAAFSGPAPLANRFVVTTIGMVARIAFCEQEPGGGPTHFRAGVSLTTSDLAELNQLLTGLLAGAVQVQVPPNPAAT